VGELDGAAKRVRDAAKRFLAKTSGFSTFRNNVARMGDIVDGLVDLGDDAGAGERAAAALHRLAALAAERRFDVARAGDDGAS
jgi:hypothetical protein